MTSFLTDVVRHVSCQSNLKANTTVIFPNRRAALYFKHIFQANDNHARLRLLTLEEFFSAHSDIKEADDVTLVTTLFNVYGQLTGSTESLDNFYGWGQMLLRDFDDVDKNLVDARCMFTDLSNLKDLDERFDFLTDEQKEVLRKFWTHMGTKSGASQESFMSVWRKLFSIYKTFQEALTAGCFGYKGLIHRHVVENLDDFNYHKDVGNLFFVGFNALTKAEQRLMEFYVKRGAHMLWDGDAFYVNDGAQEAGSFLRLHRRTTAFASSFVKPMPSHYKGQKEVTAVACAQVVSQVQALAVKLATLKDSKDFREESTVIVLADETLLLPVLNAIPPSIAEVNVSMGYPLTHSSMYKLINLLIELQANKKDQKFHHKRVLAVLSHPYIARFQKDEISVNIADTIVSKNIVYASPGFFAEAGSLVSYIFQDIPAAEAASYILECTMKIGTALESAGDGESIFAAHFHKRITLLRSVTESNGLLSDWKAFQRLFASLVTGETTPLTGSPHRGLQIMGMLETRNLDFENVFVLSVNEGKLPSSSVNSSYIPYSIRKAYALPTAEHKDAMHSYLFYRLLQRAKRITLFYVSEPDILGNGEMSRLLQQLIIEKHHPIVHEVVQAGIRPATVKQIVVAKDEFGMSKLRALGSGVGEKRRYLSPSMLNDYLDCSLRFYFKYIAEIKEPDSVRETIDSSLLGVIIHDVLQTIYKQYHRVDDVEVLVQGVDAHINAAVRRAYKLSPDDDLKLEGQVVLVVNIAREFILQVLRKDSGYAPFTIEALEKEIITTISAGGETIRIGGRIDRIDRRDDHDRVIDYKTGDDDLTFPSIDSLFERETKRNNAAFQTLLYAYLWFKSSSGDRTIQPGLMNRNNMFDERFEFGYLVGGRQKLKLLDIKPHVSDLEEKLALLLSDIYNSSVSYLQTQETTHCTYCPYKSLCDK